MKYELVGVDYLTEDGRPWDRVSFAKISNGFGHNQVIGVALVQMISDRKIKFEAFQGKTASQVSGFTENAKIYER
ncbi:MAG: hypothetical protein Q8R04_01895 [Nanoarchaeota archaeon]|nr:hypothetical protein [Nanoarchaeota archaeon]